MPYLVYKIKGGQRTCLAEFEAYREARDHVRRLRAGHARQNEGDADDDTTFRLIFASDQDEAAALMSEKRVAPILKEWEK